MPPVLADVVGVGQHVKDVLVLVGRTLVDPEQDTTDESQDSNDTVVPHEQGVLGQRDKGLTDGVGERGHEVPVRGDERTHVLGSLGEGEFQTGDGGEDLGETDKHVGDSLGPHVDWRRVITAVHLVAAGARLVDVVLDNSCRDHSERGKHETECNALDGGEADAGLAERGVEEVVNDGDEDNQGDGVEVGDDVVGDTVTGHGGSLGGKVVVHLVVRQPVQGNPSEAGAGAQTTGNLVDPGVVELHPCGLAVAEVARLNILPEALALEGLACGDGVDRPFALGGKAKELEGADEDRAGRGAPVVLVAADPKNDRATTEHDGGQEPCAPESNILLNVNHGDLTGEGTDVDEHVEVKEDTRDGNVGVRDDTLASLLIDDNTGLGLLVLLGNQRRDVGLESAGSKPKNDDTQDERSDSISASEHVGDSRDNKQNVTDDGEGDGDEDGVKATEVLIGDNGTDDGSGVGPERVEGTNTERGTLSHTETSRLPLRTGVFASGLNYTVDNRQFLLNKVGVCERSVRLRGILLVQRTKHLATVVTETLAQLDESNGEDLPRDLARDTTQCLQLLLSGGLSNEISFELDGRSIELMAGARGRVTLLASKSLLLIDLVERRSDLGLVAQGHIDLVGTGGGSHDG